MMDEVFDLTCCSSSFVPKSTLLHKPEVQYGLVPKLTIMSGKNTGFQPKKQLGYNLGKHEINTMCCNKYA